METTAFGANTSPTETTTSVPIENPSKGKQIEEKGDDTMLAVIIGVVGLVGIVCTLVVIYVKGRMKGN